jgi:hypothetical protein
MLAKQSFSKSHRQTHTPYLPKMCPLAQKGCETTLGVEDLGKSALHVYEPSIHLLSPSDHMLWLIQEE